MGVSVQGVSVQGVSVQGGSMSKGALSMGSLSRILSAQRPPYSEAQAVCILLQCFLVTSKINQLHIVSLPVNGFVLLMAKETIHIISLEPISK